MLSCAALALASCSDELETNEGTLTDVTRTESLVLTDEAGNAISTASGKCTAYYAHIHTNGDWSLQSTVPYIVPLTQHGNGDAVVKVYVGNNWQDARQGDLVLTSDDATQAETAVIRRASITQTADSSLSCIANNFSPNKGAGFSYIPSTDYSLGVNMELFNLAKLNELQEEYGYNFISDNLYPGVIDEVLTAESEQALQNLLSISASLTLDFSLVAAKVAGTYTTQEVSDNQTQYAMERIKAYDYTREINYMNIIAVAEHNPEVRTSIYAPGFYKLLQSFIADINAAATDTAVTNPICKEFLSVCGPCFISKSVMGCSLDYQIAISKDSLTEGMTLGGALEVALTICGVKVSLGGSGQYDNYATTIQNSTQSKVTVRGGNVGLVNILATNGTVQNEQVVLWQQSIEPKNCVLIDMDLVPIYSIILDQKAHDTLKDYYDSLLSDL